MADNVQWILDNEPPGTRIVLWAHNQHVSHEAHAKVPRMGFHLAGALGEDYVAFGFAFNRGRFRARDLTLESENPEAVTDHEVGPAPAPYVGATMARTGFPLLVIDLRVEDAPIEVRQWLASPHPMRGTGAGFASDASMRKEVVLPSHFDALIFVDQTTASRPTPTGVRPAPTD